MKKFHISLGVESIEVTVHDYTQRLGQPPDLVVPGEYALWRTAHLNLSVRKSDAVSSGKLRHLGWETNDADSFTSDIDCNGILWERFSAEIQAREIEELWPCTDKPTPS